MEVVCGNIKVVARDVMQNIVVSCMFELVKQMNGVFFGDLLQYV